MARKIVQTGFRMDAERLLALKMWALEHGTTIAKIFDEGADLYAAKHKFKLPKAGEASEPKESSDRFIGGAA